MGYTNDPDQAKDIAQDTFVTVWQQLANFRGESSIGTWIYRITSNNCLRYVEKQRRVRKSQLPSDIVEEPQADIEPGIQFLYKCIAELSETERVIISLELEDVNQSEIASIVGLSETNVRVKIHRIKEKLTQRFKENGF